MNGQKLKEIREKYGYSRKELAKILYETEYTVQSWEQGWGITPPTSGQIEKMAALFDIEEYNLRNLLEIDEYDDFDTDDVSFIDFVDSAVRAYQYIKKHKK